MLDLGDVTHIDSGGLGTLVGLYTAARNVGGDIKLANLGSRVNELLQITKLVTVFDVLDEVEDAVASCRGIAGIGPRAMEREYPAPDNPDQTVLRASILGRRLAF